MSRAPWYYTTLFGPVSDATVEPHTASFTIDPRRLSDILSRLLRAADRAGLPVAAES